MQDTKLTEFKATLPADEAAELARILVGDWPEGLSLELRSRKQVVSTCAPTDSIVLCDLMKHGWSRTVGWYRIRDDRMSDWLRRVIGESAQLRANDAALRLTLDTANGINAAIYGEAAE